MSDAQTIIDHHLSKDGFSVKLVSFGASISDLRMKGIDHPLVLGLQNPHDYPLQSSHLGATAGRVANRISGGQFHLNGRLYELDRNENGKHMLHGGAQGSGVQNWHLDHATDTEALFTLHQPDGWMGFPGNVDMHCHYEITDDCELTIRYTAQTDKACPINLAHHSYFKLDDSDDIRHHMFQIEADHYLDVDQDNIPTGKLVPVAGTPFDFTSPRFIENNHFDHNFCLRDGETKLRKIAFAKSELSGISLTLYSDQKGVQFYTSQHLSEDLNTIHGRAYHRLDGFCLEPQNWPDACNHEAFPSSILSEDEGYSQIIKLQFARDTAS